MATFEEILRTVAWKASESLVSDDAHFSEKQYRAEAEQRWVLADENLSDHEWVQVRIFEAESTYQEIRDFVKMAGGWMEGNAIPQSQKKLIRRGLVEKEGCTIRLTHQGAAWCKYLKSPYYC